LQLVGAVFQLKLGLVELDVLAVHGIALLGQGKRLLSQLLVGLLEFRLLRFQVGLGLLEDARLLFQLFVGGLELFLLHLQLFVELLGFGQHFLQTLTITRGFDGGADVAADEFQQLNVTVLQRAQEAEFDYPVDAVIIAGRHHKHAAGGAFAKAGTDFKVVHRHIVQANQAIQLGSLPNDAFVTVDRLFQLLLVTGEAISGGPLEAAVLFAYIQRRNRRAHVLGEKLQDIAP